MREKIRTALIVVALLGFVLPTVALPASPPLDYSGVSESSSTVSAADVLGVVLAVMSLNPLCGPVLNVPTDPNKW